MKSIQADIIVSDKVFEKLNKVLKEKGLEKEVFIAEAIKDKLEKEGVKVRKEPPKDISKEVIEYLNLKANKSYRSSGKKTQSLIRARQEEGFSLEDFKKVIDNKVDDSLRGYFNDIYLRPETLFGTKFEGYLNQGGSHGKNRSNYSKVKTTSERKHTDEEIRTAGLI